MVKNMTRRNTPTPVKTKMEQEEVPTAAIFLSTSYLAAGTSQGRLVVFDLITKDPKKEPVLSVKPCEGLQITQILKV